MKEQILNQFMEKLLHYVNSAEIFANKNVPLYIEELLKYKMYDSITVIIISIIVLFIAVAYFVFALKTIKIDERIGCYTDFSTFKVTSSSMVLVGAIILFVINLSICTRRIIKINTAPRVYVIDYLRNNGGK